MYAICSQILPDTVSCNIQDYKYHGFEYICQDIEIVQRIRRVLELAIVMSVDAFWLLFLF